MAGRTKCTLMFIICRQRLCLLTHSTMVLPQVESLKEALKSKSRMHEPCVALFPFQHFIFGQGLSVNLECLIAPIYRARRGKLDRLRPPSDHRRSRRRAAQGTLPAKPRPAADWPRLRAPRGVAVRSRRSRPSHWRRRGAWPGGAWRRRKKTPLGTAGPLAAGGCLWLCLSVVPAAPPLARCSSSRSPRSSSLRTAAPRGRRAGRWMWGGPAGGGARMAAGTGAAAGGRSFSFKVVLLGEGCVGKTSLVLRYCENKFNDKHITTLQVRAGRAGARGGGRLWLPSGALLRAAVAFQSARSGGWCFGVSLSVW